MSVLMASASFGGSDAQEPKSKKKGCIIAVVVALVLGCVASIALGVTCVGCFNFGQKEQIKNISTSLRGAAIGHPREAEYEAEITTLNQISERGDLAFLTFGILNNRYEDARLDGRIDHEELDFVMELVIDINRNGGEVSMQDYPQGR